MRSLDDTQAYGELDRSNMLAKIQELPDECLRAWDNAATLELPSSYAGRARKVLVLGMGGSAIGGDLARTLVEGECRAPIGVNRGYDLPAYVDGETLVVASSYSGNTEETLSGFRQARERGAAIIAMTTGGRLGEEAGKAGLPVLNIEYEAQPRAALAHSFVPLLNILWRLGLIGDPSEALREAVAAMKALQKEAGPQVDAASNPAKSLAMKAHGRLLDVYGAGHLAEVARRWKTQVNENSKAWALFEELPELNHNSVVGYPHPSEVRERILVILLQSPSNHPRTLRRFEVTGGILDREGIAHQTVRPRGESELAQMLSAILFGDYVSYYLGMLYGVDPTPVDVIAYLKGELAKA